MPRDVTMRWNLTYDMLAFTVKYRNALDKMTSDRKNDLCKYEMDDNDWKLAEQLRNVLKVSLYHVSNAYLTFTSSSLCPSQCQIVVNS